MIVNHTKRNIVCQEVELAFTFFTRLRGLMLRAELPKERGLLLKPCNSVHTFFMRFPIDVVFIDRSFRVVTLVENIHPWRLSRVYRGSLYALELRAGTIYSTGLTEGDALEFLLN